MGSVERLSVVHLDPFKNIVGPNRDESKEQMGVSQWSSLHRDFLFAQNLTAKAHWTLPVTP